MKHRTEEQIARYAATRREKRRANLDAARAYDRARVRKPSVRTPEQKAAYAARKRAIRAADKEAMREYDRKRRAADPEKFRARDSARWTKDEKKRDANRRFRERNAEKVRAENRAWRAANPDKVCALNAARRALKRELTPQLTADEQEVVAVQYTIARMLSFYVGIPYHVDHIKPLSKGGLHHPSNLQVLRGVDNLRKGNRV